MDKKYQIFISSTYKDLIKEREKVRDVILSMYQFPIGMEMFSAADKEQWKIIKETIDSSDYYVLIIGKRYGSVFDDGPDKGMSYTEKEYRYAKSVGIPILVYIKDERTITADNVEDDPKKKKRLKLFQTEAIKDREAKWFSSVDHLGTEVLLSLHKEMDRKKRPGWVRGDSVDIEKSLAEIVELSKQNRELQEENRNLTVEIEKLKGSKERKPLLTITLGETKPEADEENLELYQHGQYMSIDEDETIHLKLKRISTKMREAEYRPLTRDNLPEELKKHVTDQDIEEYNKGLPQEDELKKYLDEYRLYLRLKENGIATTFFVKNLGNSKATDVSVMIRFPEEVRIFDIEEVAALEEPESPKKPEDLSSKVYRRLHPIEAETEKSKKNLFSLNGFELSPNYTELLRAPRITNNTVFESIEIEDNIVEIEQKQGIVHTKFDWFTGGYIVPFAEGEFEATVTLMCAEYEDPEETTIKFVVE